MTTNSFDTLLDQGMNIIAPSLFKFSGPVLNFLSGAGAVAFCYAAKQLYSTDLDDYAEGYSVQGDDPTESTRLPTGTTLKLRSPEVPEFDGTNKNWQHWKTQTKSTLIATGFSQSITFLEHCRTRTRLYTHT